MKKILFVCLLLFACSQVDLTPVNKDTGITIPEILVAGEIVEPPVPLPSRQELLQPLLNTIKLMKEDQLPFDEPLHEIGQEDGSLRPRWEHAYFTKQGFYIFNTDKYYVYGNNKSPRPPQVCADYICDTLERTSGTWYQNHHRVVGKLDIRTAMKDQGLDPRRVPDLVSYFKSEPDNYKFIWSVDDPSFAPTNYWGGPRVTPTDGTGGLKEFLRVYDAQVGDIIIISGLAPWDNGKEQHNHSMFVASLDTDGMVSTIVGNDAWVREKKLNIEMARAPKRRLKYVIRLTDHFLNEYNKQ